MSLGQRDVLGSESWHWVREMSLGQSHVLLSESCHSTSLGPVLHQILLLTCPYKNAMHGLLLLSLQHPGLEC